jgi:hypothetical protein
MLKPHDINAEGNQIAGWYNPSDLMDRTIQWFEDNQQHADVGSVGADAANDWGFYEPKVDPTVKDSMDLPLTGGGPNVPLFEEWAQYLQSSLNEYRKLYPYCDEVRSYDILEPMNIQRYYPGQGYFSWHCENDGTTDDVSISRHLVFTTYLNTVDDGGETEFFHQKCKIKPEKGLTVIFPSAWTHTHRGVTSETKTKYIMTGWYNFYNLTV